LTDLHWLPKLADWRNRLRSLPGGPAPWDAAVALANAQLNFVLTNALDETVRRLVPEHPAGPQGRALPSRRLRRACRGPPAAASRNPGKDRASWLGSACR